MNRLAVPISVLALALAAPSVAPADPPPWAPAHGYRAKHKDKRVVAPVYYEPGPAIDLSIGRCNRELIGQVLGGAAGAAAGSQIGGGSGRLVAIAGGTLLGVLVGGEIGRSMDRADQTCVDHALEYGASGQPIVWQTPGGEGYRVTPQPAYETGGSYCREYTTTATVGGRTEQTYGTACRQPDGSWKLVGNAG